jgi:predicted DNA-binding ribbon-helix-helix protein
VKILLPINDIIGGPRQQSLRLLEAAHEPANLPCFVPDPCPIGGRGSRHLILSAPKLEKPVAATDRNAMQGSAIVKRSVRVAGHATSISLEAEFWRGLRDIAAARRMSVNALVAAIDARRGGNLSSAIRLFVLDSAQRRADERRGRC